MQVPRKSINQVRDNIVNAQFRGQTSAAAFDGGASQIADAASQTLNKVAQVVKEEQNKANDLAVETAYTSLMKKKNDLLYNEEDGFKKIGGRQSAESFQNYKDRYNTSIDEINGTLTNNAQREAFRKLSNRVGLDLEQQMQGHVFTQVQKYDDEQTQTNLASVHEDAIVNHKNPGKIQEAIETQSLIIARYGQRKGMSEGQIKESILNETSKTQYDVFNRFLANDEGNFAKEHYNAVKSNVNGSTLTKMENAITAYEARKERERKAKQSALKHDLLANLPGMEQVAMERGDVSHLRNTAQKLQEVGDVKTARKVAKKASLYEQRYSDFVQLRNLPINEAVDFVQGMKVSDDITKADTEAELRNMATKALNDRIRLFKSDPAKSVGDLAIGRTPEEQVDHRLRLQEEQGFPLEKGFRALTNEEVTANKMKFESADSRGRVNFIKEVQTNYGKHTNQVLRESGVSPTVILSRYLPEGKAQEVFVTASMDENFKNTDSSKKADITRTIKGSSFMSMLNEVKQNMGQNTSFIKQVEDMQRVMTNVSLLSNNEQAGVEIIQDNFEIINDEDKKIFYPKGINQSVVEQNLDKQKEDFLKMIKADFEDNGQLDSVEVETNRFLMNDYEHIIQDAFWVNSGNGFVMVDRASGKAFGPEVNYESFQETFLNEVEMPIVGYNRNMGTK